MKTFLFALVAGFIPALVATNGAYAQNSVNPEILEPQKNVTAIKKVVIPVNEVIAISPKAMKNFSKTYKDVSESRWDKTRDGFTVKFQSNGVNSRIYYTSKGQWSGSLKGYAEDKLPKDIREIVKREYYDFSIKYVQEVETNHLHGIPTFIIHLEGKKTLKQLRINDGQMETWREYEKQQ